MTQHRRQNAERRTITGRRTQNAAPVLLSCLVPVPALAADPSPSPPEQWYTGSLFSPSPAESAAGMLAVEPYLALNNADGRFDSHGRLEPDTTHAHDLVSQTLMKYGLTDRLSIYALPAFTEGLARRRASSGVQFGDLPVELELRVLDPNERRLIPNVTLALGVNAPTGRYDGLARAQDGVGTGAWFLRTGIVSQSTYHVSGHAVRLRVFAAERIRVSTATVSGLSAYGTQAGFHGRARPGSFGNAGASVEWGLTRQWVLALDLYRSWADGAVLRGIDADGSPVRRSAPSSGDWSVGPALEWSWSPRFGAILGVTLPVSGHDEQRTISPQLAVNCVF